MNNLIGINHNLVNADGGGVGGGGGNLQKNLQQQFLSKTPVKRDTSLGKKIRFIFFPFFIINCLAIYHFFLIQTKLN